MNVARSHGWNKQQSIHIFILQQTSVQARGHFSGERNTPTNYIYMCFKIESKRKILVIMFVLRPYRLMEQSSGANKRKIFLVLL